MKYIYILLVFNIDTQTTTSLTVIVYIFFIGKHVPLTKVTTIYMDILIAINLPVVHVQLLSNNKRGTYI